MEFDWILTKEVDEVLQHVRQVLLRCAQRFRGGELVKPEKFVLKSVVGGDNLKCVATLLEELIYEAGKFTDGAILSVQFKEKIQAFR